MLESAIEVQARIVVALGHDTAPAISNGHERIDVLAQPIADRLEADALPGRNIEGETIHRGLAEASPQGHGQRDLRRRVLRIGGRTHGQILDKHQGSIAQPVDRRQPQPANADWGVGRDRDIEHRPARRRLADGDSFDGAG